MFDYTEILQRWDALPELRITYSQDERGWAKRLDMAHVVIANVPMSADLMLYDIVTLDTDGPGLPWVAEVCQRYYAQQVSVAYLEPAEVGDVARLNAAYLGLRQVCEAAGCATAAGPHAGLVMVNTPADVDLVQLLKPLGIAPANIVVYDEGGE